MKPMNGHINKRIIPLLLVIVINVQPIRAETYREKLKGLFSPSVQPISETTSMEKPGSLFSQSVQPIRETTSIEKPSSLLSQINEALDYMMRGDNIFGAAILAMLTAKIMMQVQKSIY